MSKDGNLTHWWTKAGFALFAEVDDVFGYTKPGKIDVYAKPMSAAAGALWQLLDAFSDKHFWRT